MEQGKYPTEPHIEGELISKKVAMEKGCSLDK
jgi:hypothetical protein